MTEDIKTRKDGEDLYLRVEEAARFMNVPRGTLDQWRKAEFGPPYIKLRRRVLYAKEDLKRWLSRRKIEPNRR